MSEARVLVSTEVAADAKARRRGPLKRDHFEGALVLRPCRWVHTIGMRFPLDVAFVDRDGVVIKTIRMGRHRLGWPVSKAAWVIEAEAGAFERWDLSIGDVVELRDGPRRRPKPVGDRRPGSLVLVATPIGNLGDLSPWAREALAGAALICCEDTRRTGRLLQHAGITGVRMAVCNEHTEAARVPEVLAVLGDGGDVAVVTDAGTPGISDPGERLVRAVLDAGYGVTAVPGPAAAVSALVISGLSTARDVFEGFLPRAGRARAERLAELAAEHRTIVLYEAPHRVLRTMADLAATLGADVAVSVAGS